jgi:uncharacterized phiE125 gp8 family phage protein
VPVIDVDDLKAHLNITFDTDDDLLTAKIEAAEQHLEGCLSKAFITQTRVALLDGFPCRSPIELPRAPVQSITSIKYYDTEWTLQTLAPANYVALPLDSDQQTHVHPARGTSWPATADLIGAVEITFEAGFGDEAADVPAPIKEAVRQLAAHFYENREATLIGVSASDLPFSIQDLVAPYRSWVF